MAGYYAHGSASRGAVPGITVRRGSPVQQSVSDPLLMSAPPQMPPCLVRRKACAWHLTSILLALLAACATAGAQNANAPEVSSQETQPEFKIEVERNMVVVRAVVRDSKNRPVPGLTKEDFRLFDNGKPQAITQFAVETGAAAPGKNAAPTPAKEETEELSEEATLPQMPRNYLGLLFDDAQMSFEDIARTRQAADQYLANSVQPDDRIGIFTTSGQAQVDFTNDRAKLHATLLLLQPRPIMGRDIHECPDINDYQAYLMIYRRDPYALESATEEAFTCWCANLPPQAQNGCQQQIPARVESQAGTVLNMSENQIEYSLRGLEGLVRRMKVLPGRHNIIFVSPGFLSYTIRQQLGEITDRALRANVVINSFDSKGLYVGIPYNDPSQPNPVIPVRAPNLLGRKEQFLQDGIRHAEEVLQDLAMDTGGQFFHNSNDLNRGFRDLGALEGVSYVLAFSPQNLKRDGSFHTLTVKLVKPAGVNVQARRGYFAPQKSENAAAQAKEEIQQAIFSQDEMHELPVEVHTQFFKVNDSDARLSVLVHLDLRALHFRKDEGRNLNNVTFVTAIFDRDGKYVAGREKILEFRLRDTSLGKLQEEGLSVKASFSMKPGTYTVRQVVRDAQGGEMSGLNRVVDIPY